MPSASIHSTASYRSRLLAVLKTREYPKTACPSEVLAPHLKKSKPTMAKVREAAGELQKEGVIEILRGGKRVSLDSKGPIRLRLLRPKAKKFDYSLNFKRINFRKSPEKYAVGKGEQGVLLVEPYKSEILPYWRFKTPEIALTSAKQIYSLFESYAQHNDFIGMDMARKFLQMGVTRSRRYANHKSGQKYIGPVPKNKKGRSGAHGRKIAKLEIDPIKAKSADIFIRYLNKANTNKKYKTWLASNR